MAPASLRPSLLLTAIALIALHAQTAQAQPHTVCLYLDLGELYWDASPRAADGEDFREEYGRNEGPTSFAEERFASIGEQPLHDARIYVSHDPQGVLPGKTQADRTFGNQPSVIVEGLSWHSKHTIAHELGHQQTIAAANPSFGPSDLDYCYDPTLYPEAPACSPPSHAMDSHEWQAAAAVEGIASWYAVSVWNDVDLVECQSCQPGVRYVIPSSPSDASTYVVPRTSPLCTALDQPQCPPGVGNEWDWLSAFRLFRLQAPVTPSFRTMLTMLSAAYASGPWSPRSADGAFWTAFDQAMAVHLGPNHAAWQTAAAEMELDR